MKKAWMLSILLVMVLLAVAVIAEGQQDRFQQQEFERQQQREIQRQQQERMPN